MRRSSTRTSARGSRTRRRLVSAEPRIEEELFAQRDLFARQRIVDRDAHGLESLQARPRRRAWIRGSEDEAREKEEEMGAHAENVC